MYTPVYNMYMHQVLHMLNTPPTLHPKEGQAIINISKDLIMDLLGQPVSHAASTTSSVFSLRFGSLEAIQKSSDHLFEYTYIYIMKYLHI